MKTQLLENKESAPSNFSEFDDDGSLYKNCINCGQSQYPFKHGICRLCGENNWTVDFEKPKTQKLGIMELIDN